MVWLEGVVYFCLIEGDGLIHGDVSGLIAPDKGHVPLVHNEDLVGLVVLVFDDDLRRSARPLLVLDSDFRKCVQLMRDVLVGGIDGVLSPMDKFEVVVLQIVGLGFDHFLNLLVINRRHRVLIAGIRLNLLSDRRWRIVLTS